MAEMKGIKLCGECGNYDWKKHKCKIGCNDDSNAQASFYGDCPLPDVVPKSEVDRLETEIRLLTENSISAKYPCHILCSKGLILTKSLEEYDELLADIASEVAREIFEEIEKDGKYAISFVENLKSYSEEVRQAKLECYKDIQNYIAELKKKYTESEGEE